MRALTKGRIGPQSGCYQVRIALEQTWIGGRSDGVIPDHNLHYCYSQQENLVIIECNVTYRVCFTLYYITAPE